MFFSGSLKRIIIDRGRIRAALFPTEQGPIVRSRLQNDFYKYTMGQFFHRYYRGVNVGYRFKNRSTKIRLADEINPDDLRRELDYVGTLRYTEEELKYMGNVRNDGAFMFSDAYLEALEASVLPPYQLDVEDGQFKFETGGIWHDTTDWELYTLPVISSLRTEALMKKLNPAERDEVVEYTARQAEHKIATLRQHPNVRFSDFGTRRPASPLLQYLIDEAMLEYLPRGQFIGTSNVLFAMMLQTMAMGTIAHEESMVLAALADSDEELRYSPIKGLRQWWEMYGWNLSIILPDTFGSNWMFKNLPPEFARKWKGMRPDSMEPNEFAAKQIAFYKRHGQDARERLMIPSDGLSLESMIKVTEKWQDQIKVSSGWGTLLTNDTGLGHPSIVIKAVTANGRGTVKLSDNIQKAMGEEADIERYKQIFEYDAVRDEECVV